uniref:X-ray repair cross-complementing protein 5 n=1 Tax=Sinocyclocheilus grahami TaxID=75366 RepID=A0A672QJM0_SINGR
MARAAKSALVLCMDVGFSMSNSEPGQEPSFEQAKKVIQKFVQRQVFAENKDEVGLVLFGTDGTKNGLAKDGQYENITVHRHLMMPDFELLEEIESELQPGGQQADWLDALVVCMDLLQKETMGKKFERLNIVLLTDLNVQTSADQLDVIIDSLKKAGITLQFFLPFPVDGEDRADGGGDGPGPSAAPARPGKGLSRQQTQGLEMVKNIMTSLEEEDSLEEVYTFSDALQKLSIFKRIDRRPMAWPCQLTIGSSLTIRIVGYKAVTEEKVKKSWAIVEAQSHQRDDVKRETVYCLDDDNETEVQKDDTIQGFRYGSDIVPFSKVDEDQMKYKSDGKCFSVLGFTKQELIRRHQFMGSQVVKVFAPRDDEHAAVALSALIRALDSLKMAAIVRYAYDRRSNPQVGAAFPCIKEKYECLLYVQLPFMEDLRQFTFPVLENNKKFTPSASQLSAVDALIDSMMLVEKDEDGESVDVFKVNHFPNPQFQRLFQCLHHRGVNPDDPLPPVEPWLKRDLERPQAVSARCQTALQDVKTKFPLKVVVKKKEQKTSADVFGSSADEPDAKKVKVDEETEFNLAEIAKGNITSVRLSWVISNEIKTIIQIDAFAYALLTAPAHNVLHQSGNAELFNSYMQSLKRSVPDRNLQEFWDLLIQDALTLISKDEVDGSTFSKQDANQFLAFEQKEEVQAAPVQEDTGDVDDLVSVSCLFGCFNDKHIIYYICECNSDL